MYMEIIRPFIYFIRNLKKGEKKKVYSSFSQNDGDDKKEKKVKMNE